MAPSEANIEASPVNKPAANEAHQLANKFILSHVQDKLTADPTSNHSDFLHERAQAYDQLVSRLAQVQVAVPSTERQTQPVEPDPESRWLLLQQPVEVVHRLDASVMKIALGTAQEHDLGQSATLSEDTLAALNTAMRQGEILWKLHSTHVIALSSSEAVKISISLEMDEISNLQYLNSLSLDIPIPQHLGTLKSGERTHLFKNSWRRYSLRYGPFRPRTPAKKMAHNALVASFRVHAGMCEESLAIAKLLFMRKQRLTSSFAVTKAGHEQPG
ncbi:Protein kinase-like domain protein [Akanthomyces lecanii RCEF 1005]|uniref:Protein kinase-like domain protein n=1 Tax=Akanthomyces lecanii RCEF 1005 TaxID=1081108 RepID=A0A162K283_CORDF|nr:Protein kinase-like domain protein [Akanthomyces lecanii RCEF 1005]